MDGYRGLWGLDTWDPWGGERAPSGPKYERDGSVRLAWRNPLEWAGLDKVLPPREVAAAMEQLLAGLELEKTRLAPRIEAQRDALRKLELEVQSLRQTVFLTILPRRREGDLTVTEAELRTLSDHYNDIQESQEASADQLARIRQGDFGDPRAHIRHAHLPQPAGAPASDFARWWAAVSGGFILLLIVALVYLQPPSWPFWLVGITIVFGGVDAATRGRLPHFLLQLAILLALLNSALRLYRFWWLALILGLIALVLMMIRDNLRELADG